MDMPKKKIEVVFIDSNGVDVAAKECTGCGVVKPLELFSKSSDGSAGGRQPKCKECRSNYFKKNYIPSEKKNTSIEIVVVDGVETESKSCTKCGVLKPLEDYHKEKQGIGGRRSYCKSCGNSMSQRWKEANRDHLRQYDRDRWANNTEKESLRKIKAYDPEKARIRFKSWAESNPKKVSSRNARRVNRIKKLLNSMTVQDVNNMLSHFEHKCALTGGPSYVLDHFIAVKTGNGGTYPGNIIPISEYLNSSKKDRNPFEWIKKPHIQEKILPGAFERIIKYLSELNGMTPEQYEKYVYECYSQ